MATAGFVTLVTAFHLVVFLIYVITLVSDIFIADVKPIEGNYLSKAIWLTYVNLTIQLIYHFIAIIVSHYVRILDPTRFMRVFHGFATSIVAPLALTVTVLFWSLYAVDPYLVLPGAYHFSIYSFITSQAVHSLPSVAMIGDFLLWRHPYPPIFYALLMITVFIALYMLDMFAFYLAAGIWPYPFLVNMPWLQRIGTLTGCALIVYFMFFICLLFNWIIGKCTMRSGSSVVPLSDEMAYGTTKVIISPQHDDDSLAANSTGMPIGVIMKNSKHMDDEIEICRE